MPKPSLRSSLCLVAMCVALNGGRPTIATAQSAVPVSATSKIQFAVSPDHARVDGFGRPLVDRYDLIVTVQGLTAPVLTKSLGKPTPNASSVAEVVVPEFGTLPVNVLHTAVVRAANRDSFKDSGVSLPFGVPGMIPEPGAPGIPVPVP